jgi:hypothetical protein
MKPLDRMTPLPSLVCVATLLFVQLLGVTPMTLAQVQQGLPTVTPSAPQPLPSRLKDTKDSSSTGLKSMGVTGITGNKKLPQNGNSNGGLNGVAGSTLATCWNCGTLMSVTDSRTKAKSAWLNATNPSDTTQASAQAADKLGDKAPDKTSDNPKAGPAVAGGNISRPDAISIRPAYNIGAKVKVVGNSLMPR